MAATGQINNKALALGLDSRGFTLVELLIVLVLAAIMIGAIYSSYAVQQKSYVVQENVSEMQQNIRAAMLMLENDLRMAGYDPTDLAGAGFVDGYNFSNGGSLTETVYSNATQVSFTADLDDDGTIDRAAEDINGDGNKDLTEMEQISYRLNGTDLQRYSTVSGAVEWQTIAENIEQIEFNYILADGTSTTTPNAAQLDSIRAVQVSILAKSSHQDQEFSNKATYTTASGATWGPFNDNLRRRFLSVTL